MAIVDDDKVILESLVEVLTSLGFEPVPFNCPRLALATIKVSDIYLMITDYQMSEMTGPELISELKKERPLIECMVMTANGYRDTIIESMRAGASDFIRKPFGLDELEYMIKNAIGRLKSIPKLSDLEKVEIKRALAVCNTEKEAAEKLGINYTTLYRKKKAS